MLDYSALAAMACVIREGSFERAAQQLGITPSAVSQRVRGLEERLGAILIRRGQPCTATDLGRMLCAHVDHVRLLEAELAPALSPALSPGGINAAPPAISLAINADSLATWFPAAAASFMRQSGLMLDLTLDDEKHTAERLRSGEVLGAITADPEPAPGCRSVALGALDYIACASPDFMQRHFADGVTVRSLSTAPCMGFDRRDNLQMRWAREVHGADIDPPTLWVPSTHAFVDFALAGVAWAMQPVQLAAPHLAAGRLAELTPGAMISVPLFWNVVRLHAASLKLLSDAVVRSGRQLLRRSI
ncbi:MAG: LysR family transcriptional regulator ArgP [Sphingomonadales bacterium]|nr:LysR family transcriptional regulator ArgP [Sphingomonadales bacterium]MDE2170001.1 LysR family transcriptional regulator ArgP [Sphingomonadales bacterium]